MNVKYIPKYIGSSFQALWWEIDELGIFFAGTIIGIIFGFFFLSILISGLVMHYYSKYKEKTVRGFFKHALYWYGFKDKKKLIKSHMDKFIR